MYVVLSALDADLVTDFLHPSCADTMEIVAPLLKELEREGIKMVEKVI